MTLEYLKQAFQQPLPGAAAHRKAMSYLRQRAEDARREASPRESAVMAVFFPKNAQTHLLFIVRTGGGGVHSGQVAFPGGAKDPDDTSLLETAQRELFEETGIHASTVEVIGELTEVYIPPSNFVVKPYVAWSHQVPELVLSPDEVQKALMEPMANLLDPGAVALKSTFIPKYQVTMEVPSFDIQGHQLWGATAMMVMEIRELFGSFSTR